jgi:hypothetical protein
MDEVFDPAVGRNYIVDRQPMQLSDEFEIRAELAAVAHGNINYTARQMFRSVD